MPRSFASLKVMMYVQFIHAYSEIGLGLKAPEWAASGYVAISVIDGQDMLRFGFSDQIQQILIDHLGYVLHHFANLRFSCLTPWVAQRITPCFAAESTERASGQ